MQAGEESRLKRLWNHMFTRRTENALAISLVIAVGFLAGGCRHYQPPNYGSRLDMRLTGANSPADIENMIRETLAEIYPGEDIAESYKMYYVTNVPAPLVFAQVGNGPRGLYMFSLYCYEQERPDTWLLRGYVPVNAYYYTNSLDRNLSIQMDSEYVKVAFRGEIIFTIACKKHVTARPTL
jgi:hypothetical protein